MGDMLATLKAAWRNEDLHKRLLFTMFMLVLFRIGGSIPVPGIDRVAFTEIIKRFGTLGSIGLNLRRCVDFRVNLRYGYSTVYQQLDYYSIVDSSYSCFGKNESGR